MFLLPCHDVLNWSLIQLELMLKRRLYKNMPQNKANKIYHMILFCKSLVSVGISMVKLNSDSHCIVNFGGKCLLLWCILPHPSPAVKLIYRLLLYFSLRSLVLVMRPVRVTVQKCSPLAMATFQSKTFMPAVALRNCCKNAEVYFSAALLCAMVFHSMLPMVKSLRCDTPLWLRHFVELCGEGIKIPRSIKLCFCCFKALAIYQVSCCSLNLITVAASLQLPFVGWVACILRHWLIIDKLANCNFNLICQLSCTQCTWLGSLLLLSFDHL